MPSKTDLQNLVDEQETQIEELEGQLNDVADVLIDALKIVAPDRLVPDEEEQTGEEQDDEEQDDEDEDEDDEEQTSTRAPRR